MESIVLGGGCFWCLHAAYTLVKGVESVEMGYAGGSTTNPSSDTVYHANTGHAEVVRISFDSSVLSLDEILEIFWILHDPTTLNRQGPDVGSEYRSAIFYANDAQKLATEDSKQKAQAVWDNKIVTEITNLEEFYPAEDYHKDYEQDRPDYCQIIINPKLQKLRAKFASRLKP